MHKSFTHHFYIVAFIILSLFVACSDDDKDKSGFLNPNAQTLTHDGLLREYIIHIPPSYDGKTEFPVVLNFHGFGGIASEFMAYTSMQAVADANNFILVYPQGAILDGYPHWNAGLESSENKSNIDDFGFIETLLTELSSNYTINNKRVYACGFSNGAFFSYSLACFHSDLIAAVGSVSGTMLEETYTSCSPNHPTAMINIHGTNDNIVPYNGSTGLKPINEVINYWINFNKTSTDTIESINDGDKTIEHYSYLGGEKNTSVDHYKVIGGDHVWFDINYKGANTSELLWNFFSQYDINGLR